MAVAVLPALPVIVNCGSRLAIATPTCAVARREFDQTIQQLEAAHDGHAHIAEHNIGLIFQHGGEARLAVVREGHLIAALREFLRDERRGLEVVLYTQDFFTRRRHMLMIGAAGTGVYCDRSQ
jgi:hypothetical protein